MCESVCEGESNTAQLLCGGGVPTVAAAATAVGIRPKVTDSFLRWWIEGKGRRERR